MKRRALVILAASSGWPGPHGRQIHEISIYVAQSQPTLQPFQKHHGLGINGRASIRAEFEDQLCAAITRPGIQCSPSYSLIPRPTGTPLDMNDLRNVVSGQNIDAIVASRLVKVDKTVTYIPGQAYPMFPVYGTFYGYYSAIYPVVYSPDYLRVDKTAQVETNFYSAVAPDGVLVWTGTSDTVNPEIRQTRRLTPFRRSSCRN